MTEEPTWTHYLARKYGRNSTSSSSSRCPFGALLTHIIIKRMYPLMKSIQSCWQRCHRSSQLGLLPAIAPRTPRHSTSCSLLRLAQRNLHQGVLRKYQNLRLPAQIDIRNVLSLWTLDWARQHTATGLLCGPGVWTKSLLRRLRWQYVGHELDAWRRRGQTWWESRQCATTV